MLITQARATTDMQSGMSATNVRICAPKCQHLLLVEQFMTRISSSLSQTANYGRETM